MKKEYVTIKVSDYVWEKLLPLLWEADAENYISERDIAKQLKKKQWYRVWPKVWQKLLKNKRRLHRKERIAVKVPREVYEELNRIRKRLGLSWDDLILQLLPKEE